MLLRFKIAIRNQALKMGEAQPMKKKGLVLRKNKEGRSPAHREKGIKCWALGKKEVEREA